MFTFEPKSKTLKEVHGYMLHAISPRPIALVGTVSPSGKNNLAPFSFFNGFGSNPPTVGFSAATSARTGKHKDTYENIMATKECTIQVVTFAMVEQVSLTSVENPDVDEFVIGGLTPIPSDLIKAPRCQESPIQMECILKHMVHLGEGGGAGNLAICEIIKFHIDETIIGNGGINPHKLDLVGRNGGAYYTRASGAALFKVERPVSTNILGWNGLPKSLLNSKILTGNNLARLANCERLPTKDEVLKFIDALELKKKGDSKHHDMLSLIVAQPISDQKKRDEHLEKIIQVALQSNDVEFARHVAGYVGVHS